jgi:hypothetical protein
MNEQTTMQPTHSAKHDCYTQQRTDTQTHTHRHTQTHTRSAKYPRLLHTVQSTAACLNAKARDPPGPPCHGWHVFCLFLGGRFWSVCDDGTDTNWTVYLLGEAWSQCWPFLSNGQLVFLRGQLPVCLLVLQAVAHAVGTCKGKIAGSQMTFIDWGVTPATSTITYLLVLWPSHSSPLLVETRAVDLVLAALKDLAACRGSVSSFSDLGQAHPFVYARPNDSFAVSLQLPP